MKTSKGYIHLYTGNGKGKTTAALGLSLRAAGAGLKILIAQFFKKGNYSEIKSLRKFRGSIDIKQFGTGRFVIGKPLKKDIDKALKGLAVVQKAVHSEKYNMVILDEVLAVLEMRIISPKGLLEIIKAKTHGMEVILTGRNAPPEIIKAADLVTEMKEKKHYYKKGVKARKGIEY